MEPPFVDPKLVRFCRNMVTLVAEVEPIQDEPTTGNSSGFLIWFRRKQWLVTAGHFAHVLVETHRTNRLLKVFSADAWSNPDGLGVPVILPIGMMDRWIILGGEHSYDVGLLELGENLSAQIGAGPVDTVPEQEWMTPPADFDFYAMIGTPGELVKANELRQTGPRGEDVRHLPTAYQLIRGFFRLEKTTRYEGAAITSHERFYGKVTAQANGHVLAELAGVSGGPVFGCFQTGDTFTCRTIAVQSGWNKKRKTITADYLSLLPEKFVGSG